MLHHGLKHGQIGWIVYIEGYKLDITAAIKIRNKRGSISGKKNVVNGNGYISQ